jgi:hypothetical protein
MIARLREKVCSAVANLQEITGLDRTIGACPATHGQRDVSLPPGRT